MKKTVKKVPKGFPKLLHELSEGFGQIDRLFDKINFILTLNGKVLLEDGLESLSEMQISLYEQLKQFEGDIVFSSTVDTTESGIWMKLGIKGYGRIIFTEHHLDEENSYARYEEGDMIFGYVCIPQQQYDAAMESYRRKKIEHRSVIEEACSYMHQRTQHELDEIVKNIHFICYHMAPVMYYTAQETITNFYQYNNFIREMGGPSEFYLLNDLIGKPVEEWSEEHCLLIYSLHALFLSGPPARGEEFNAKQVNPNSIKRFFETKWEEYGHYDTNLIEDEDKKRFVSGDLLEKAKLLNETRSKLTHRNTFYRSVNGLNLLKKEEMFAKTEINNMLNLLPQDIQHYFTRVYKIKVEHYDDLYPGVRSLIRSNNEDIASLHPNIMLPLEEVIHAVIDSAVRFTKSDMGMSRSLRDFKQLIHAHDHNLYTEACNWKQTDFFCCVVPNASLVKALVDKGPLLPSILKSVSIRMQYNSWHYTPGNFKIQDVPADRHFYFPPVMPDTAVWSDQHHRGHIHASVRHSIRSPYHIMYKGKRYNAFFDLRLMRQRGDEYTLEDLQHAIRYTMYLYQIYQAIFDAIAEGELSFKFESFTKEWYDTFYGSNTIYKEEIYAN